MGLTPIPPGEIRGGTVTYWRHRPGALHSGQTARSRRRHHRWIFFPDPDYLANPSMQIGTPIREALT